jgi:hypothetical protein
MQRLYVAAVFGIGFLVVSALVISIQERDLANSGWFELITGIIEGPNGNHSEPITCQDALDQYRFARSDITGALSALASCIAVSEGHEDCEPEFSVVASKQRDFESAAAAIMKKRALAYHLDGLFSGHYESECPAEIQN